MRSYNRVSPKFWTSSTVDKMSEDARNLFLYLITCPHNNILGMFKVRLAYVSADLRWSTERVSNSLKELLDIPKASGSRGVVSWDQATSLLLVHSHLKHNPLDNENQVKGAVACLAELPVSPRLYHELLQRVKRLGLPKTLPLEKALANGFETVSKPFRTPSPLPSPLPSQEQDKIHNDTPPDIAEPPGQERPALQLEPNAPAKPAVRVKKIKKGYDAEFEILWGAFPAASRRNVAKAQALKSYERARLLSDPEVILRGAQAMAKQWDEKPPGAFVPRPPMATTWLNQQRWTADYSMPEPEDRGSKNRKPEDDPYAGLDEI